MNWTLKRAVNGPTNGIEWKEGKRTADLDLADDIALLESSWEGMIEMTGRVEEKAAKVG